VVYGQPGDQTGSSVVVTADAANGRLGELLVARGLVSASDVNSALALQPQLKLRLGAVLVRLGSLSEDVLYGVLSEQLGMPVIDAASALQRLSELHAGLDAAGTPLTWFHWQGAVPFLREGGDVEIAARDPLVTELREHVAIAFADAPRVTWSLMVSRDLERVFLALKHSRAAAAPALGDDVGRLRELAQEAPVIELASSIFAAAVDVNASDIHLEPGAYSFVVRFRIDGVLHNRDTYARDRFDALCCRIKLISGLDIAERRLPQDGRVSVRAGGREIDVRVSVVPGVHGESIVLRLLPKERGELSLARLGLEPDHSGQFERWIADPNGIVLVTGPTGSGKSTTLYTALALANDGRRKILTVEDPVEFEIPGITQIQTHTEIGYTFARAVRSFLRHDPDVIMVGEIRDSETAQIAVQSALTGHMVFSTLHTNDAVGAFNRLLDMGIEPFLVASSVRGVIAQRLVRRLCPHCCEPTELDALHAGAAGRLASNGTSQAWRRAVGCSKCDQTGYRGRIGIYEFVPVTPAIQQGVLARASGADLQRVAGRLSDYRSLREDGLLKARVGITTIDEVVRVTGTSETYSE
jgi:general secretion pathway protein E